MFKNTVNHQFFLCKLLTGFINRIYNRKPYKIQLFLFLKMNKIYFLSTNFQVLLHFFRPITLCKLADIKCKKAGSIHCFLIQLELHLTAQPIYVDSFFKFVNQKTLFMENFFFFCLSLGFLPVVGPLTLGAALLCSSWAGYDMWLYPKLITIVSSP